MVATNSDAFSKRPNFTPSIQFFDRFNRHCDICERAILTNDLSMLSSGIKVVSSLAKYYVENEDDINKVLKKIEDADTDVAKLQNMFTDSDDDPDVMYEINLLRRKAFDKYHIAYGDLMFVCAKSGLQLSFKKKNQKLKAFGEQDDDESTKQSDNGTTDAGSSTSSSAEKSIDGKPARKERKDNNGRWVTV